MTLSPASPPPIEALSPDLQFKLWERQRNRLKRSWILTMLLCSPAIAFIAVKPINDTVSTIYKGAQFLHWLTGLATLPQPGSGAAIVPAGTAGLNEKQTAVAQEIIQAGIDRGLDQADIRLALMTAMQESTMQELEHGDDWYFQQMGWGEKSDSVGPFQQRDSWGSRECRIDAKCSANLFYDALLQVSDRHSMPEWKAITKVQRPAEWAEQHYQQWDEKADEILKAVQAAPASATAAAPSGKTVPFKGIQVTSARDSSGEPGLDYVVSNGDRGAEFGALAAGTVVEVVADQHWESHLEAGGQERGYGNLVVVRVNESGQEIDMLYAHLDRVDVKQGDRVAVGTVLGTQGRTGSTTGAHISVDFFAPGTRTANDASLAMRDRVAGILQSNPESLNQQVQMAQAPASAPQNKPGWDFSDIRLPFFQQLQAAPASDPNGFTVEVWIQTDEGPAPASGIIIQQDGLILTNHHVIDNGFLYVKTTDGKQYQGRTIASDVSLDLALVQIDGASGLPVAPLAQSANVQPGDTVKAIGSPVGMHWKHSEAQVIATDSMCGLKPIDGKCIRTPSEFLYPGNSGGPLLNAQGEVIGVNRAIGQLSGEGISIPIEVFHKQFKMP